MNRQYSNQDTQIVNKHLKGGSTSISIRVDKYQNQNEIPLHTHEDDYIKKTDRMLNDMR